jgi:hypothetical protein
MDMSKEGSPGIRMVILWEAVDAVLFGIELYTNQRYYFENIAIWFQLNVGYS